MDEDEDTGGLRSLSASRLAKVMRSMTQRVPFHSLSKFCCKWLEIISCSLATASSSEENACRHKDIIINILH
jgi:hypothetical protein